MFTFEGDFVQRASSDIAPIADLTELYNEITCRHSSTHKDIALRTQLRTTFFHTFYDNAHAIEYYEKVEKCLHTRDKHLAIKAHRDHRPS